MPNSTIRRAALLGGVASLALAVSTGAQAQAQDSTAVEAVVVTGSRIARPDLDAAIPITVVDAKTLERDGASNVQDILRELPQIGVGTTRANSNFATTGNGAATIDLRNLGPSRTLVLVNGRRYVAGFPGTSAVDLNNIPTDFIERVDVVTGGTSAVYGSDAIAGVVNFVLKDDFTGLTARAEYGLTEKGDNERYLASITAGRSFGPNDAGHIAINATYENEDGVLSRDRNISRYDRSWATVGVNAFSSFPPQGRFDLRTASGSAQVFTFDQQNNVVLGFPQALAYNRNGDRRISLPVERALLSANITYKLGDSATFFLEPTYSNVSSSALLEAYSFDWSFIYKNGEAGMPITNAYIPASIQNLITARNSDASTANDITGIQFRRRQNEVYDRSNQAERDTYRVATGVRGEFGDDWRYELSYVYGRMKDSTVSQDIDATKYIQALDSIKLASGQIVCRDITARAAGCVPINLFGFDTVTKEGADYVIVPRWVKIENTEQVLTASLTGNLFELPAGKVGFAVGAEHRRERSETDWDAVTNAGNGTSGKQDDLFGRFDVTEAFGEVHVPLVADRAFVRYLGLNGAARYSHYSTVGGALSWNLGLEYVPVSGLKLRGGYAVANRAPNISELYAAVTGGSGNGSSIVDPCTGTTAAGARPQDAACRKIPGLLVEASDNGGALTYTAFDINWMTVQQGGNPNLTEETAKTLTVGAVLTPEALPGFHLSTDYFRIRIDDAIGALPAQIVVDRCISTSDPFYCNAVERFPNGKLRRISTRLVNVAEIETSGVDVNVGYSRPTGLISGDRLGVNLLYTRLLSLEKRSYIGGPLEENLGQLYAEGRLGSGYKHRANLRLSYDAGGFSGSWQVNYLGAIKDRLDWTPPAGADQALLADLNSVDAVIYHDVQGRYAFGEGRRFEIYGGVNNLFDTPPPLLPTGFASNITGVESAKEYDPYGRRYYAGVRYRF